MGDSDGQVISTILGSCVSVCLWDCGLRLGGMNHILVPEGGFSDLGARGAGATAMERLINTMMKRGAQRDRLIAKVFGGAAIVSGLSDIGAQNSAFVLDYLETERIPCSSKCVGGSRARLVRFWPASGRAQQRFVRADDAPKVWMPARPPASELELL